MAWWIWIGGGALLAALELAVGGELWLLFLGLAAVVVGLAAGSGLTSLAVQLALFAALAVSAFFVRRRLSSTGEAETVGSDSLVGEIGTAATEIRPGKPGHAEFRGSRWPARAAAEHRIEAGSRVRVTRMQGITLFVEPR